MPTYDYVCDACAHELELFQSMSEAPKRKCPACGAMKLRRRVGTGAGILFKGTGFYQTDYRSDSYKKAETASRNGGGEPAPEGAPKSPAPTKPSAPTKQGADEKKRPVKRTESDG